MSLLSLLRPCLGAVAAAAFAVGGVCLRGQTVAEEIFAAEAWARTQLLATQAEIGTDPARYPTVTKQSTVGGAWETSATGHWATGFFPGQLWLSYLATGDTAWATEAARRTAPVEAIAATSGNHDYGFIFLSSAGQGYALTGEDHYRQTVLTAAGSLSGHWMPNTQALWSFGFGSRGWRSQQNVIIDSAMNVEGLLWAAAYGADPDLYDKGLSHWRVQARDHVRPDGSTIQVVDYYERSPYTNSAGQVFAPGSMRGTYAWQGHSNTSTWARGQGWAVHGFATAYRLTKDPQFLEIARRTARFYLERAPADGVAWWDFEAPNLVGTWPLVRDTSAASVTAAGLFDLALSDPDPALRQRWLRGGERILHSLATQYLTRHLPAPRRLNGLLKDGAYTVPRTNSTAFDQSLSWGDFYFMQAIARYRALVAPLTEFADGPLGSLAVFDSSDPARWQVVHESGQPRLWLRPAGAGDATAMATGHWAWTAAEEFADFALSLRYRPDEVLARRPTAALAIAFGRGADGRQAWLQLGPTAETTGLFVRADATAAPVAVALANRPGLVDWRWQTVSLRRVGHEVIALLGDTPLVSATDESLGEVGALALGGLAGTSGFFDDLVLDDNATQSGGRTLSAWARFRRERLGAHPIEAHPLVDADGDGWPNVVELALGSDPRQTDRPAGALRWQGGPAVGESTGPARVRYGVDPALVTDPTLTVVAEYWNDGENPGWQAAPAPVAVAGPLGTAWFEVTLPPGVSPRLVRLVVRALP